MSSSPLALSFRIFQNGQLLREDTLTQAVIKIGKVPSAHLRIDDDAISRMHAIIEVSNREVSLIDLGSTRGTFVNGKRINKARLQSGDTITLGDTRLELALGDAAPIAPAPTAIAVRPPPLPVAALRHVAVDTPTATSEPAVLPMVLATAAPLPTVPSVVESRELSDSRGARAVEVAAMLGDSVVGVKHCMNPRGGKVTPATWGLLATGAACLIAAAVAFAVSLHTAADNKARLEVWTRVDHRPGYAFRPTWLGPGIDWVAFGGLALGIAGVTLGVSRLRRDRPSPYYRIGSAPGVELAIEHAPAPAFPLVAPSGDDFVFNYGDGIDGELIVGGIATPLRELAAAGRARPSMATAGAVEVPIPRNARIRARSGQTTFVVSAIAPPARHTSPLLAGLERRTLGYVAGSLAAHIAVLGLLQLVPPEDLGLAIDLSSVEGTTTRVQGPALDTTVPEPIADHGGADGASSGNAPAMALASGTAGRPDAPHADGHLRIAATRNERQQMSRDEAMEIAARDGILGSELLRSGVKLASATSDYADGFDSENVNGLPSGPEAASRGNFGGGFSGDGPGGGCIGGSCGADTISAGRYGTIPGGPGRRDFGFPRGGGPGGPVHHQTLPPLGRPTISGTYDREIVRRYIRHQLNQITYCYDKQLLAHPDLSGEITVSFLISPNGAVQGAAGRGFDREVASCVADAIAAIAFPPPGEGGVQVSYPFQFHTAR